MSEPRLFTPEDPSFLLLLSGAVVIVLFAAWMLARHWARADGTQRRPGEHRLPGRKSRVDIARDIRAVLDELREVDTELQQLRAGSLLGHPTPHLARHRRLLEEYRAILADRLNQLTSAERVLSDLHRHGRVA